MMSYEFLGRHLKLWYGMLWLIKGREYHEKKNDKIKNKLSPYLLTIMLNVLPVKVCVAYLKHWRKEAKYGRNHHGMSSVNVLNTRTQWRSGLSRFNKNEVCTTVLSGFKTFVRALSLLGESLTSVMHFSVLFAWLSKLGMQVLPSGLHQYNNIPWTN